MLRPNFPKKLLQQLAEIHGTPLLVGSRSGVRTQFRRLQSSLRRVKYLYAVKACDNPVLLQLLAEEGCGFDIASLAEWEQIQGACETPTKLLQTEPFLRLVHSHPCKKANDIRACYASGVRRFVFDSLDEIDKLVSLASDARCFVRMNTPNRSGQVDLSNRFGADPDEIIELVRYARESKLNVDGLAFHVGSQAYDPRDFDSAIRTARELWDRMEEDGFQLKHLDIGGGFPVSYRDRQAMPIEEYAASIDRSLSTHFADKAVLLLAEPGRIIAAESFILVTSIIGVQRRAGQACYTIDDGRYGTFSGRYFSKNTFDFIPLNESKSERRPVMIVGPTCDGGTS